MRSISLFVLALVLFFATAGFVAAGAAVPKHSAYKAVDLKVAAPKSPAKSPVNFDACPLCVQLMDQTIGQLLNIILNVGVIGSCNKLCSYLKPEGQTVVTACNLVCDIVGVEAFIRLIKKADLDPIWMCEETKFCPIHDCTLPVCAEFGSTDVIPATGPKGSTFTIQTEWTVYNQTGAGEFLIVINPPGAEPLADGELVSKGFQKGTQAARIDVEIADDPQHQIIMPTGVYKGFIALCQGMCGSHHAHTRLLAQTHFNFTVTSH